MKTLHRDSSSIKPGNVFFSGDFEITKKERKILMERNQKIGLQTRPTELVGVSLATELSENVEQSGIEECNFSKFTVVVCS